MQDYSKAEGLGYCFTADELAGKYGVTVNNVTYNAGRLGVGELFMQKHNGFCTRKRVYNSEDVKVLDEYYLKHTKLKELKKQPFTPSNLKELKKAHPLVTDDRCFNLNWWPETEPYV